MAGTLYGLGSSQNEVQRGADLGPRMDWVLSQVFLRSHYTIDLFRPPCTSLESLRQYRPSQIDLAQFSPSQLSPTQVGPSQIDIREGGLRKLGLVEVSLCPIRFRH